VQVRRPIQSDDPILEGTDSPDTSLGWGSMNGNARFKTDPVAFQRVQCLHPGGQNTPVILEHLGAIVQTDVN
jgi:hypothetical protein